jgi:hypothetical protein
MKLRFRDTGALADAELRKANMLITKGPDGEITQTELDLLQPGPDGTMIPALNPTWLWTSWVRGVSPFQVTPFSAMPHCMEPIYPSEEPFWELVHATDEERLGLREAGYDFE